MYTVAVDHANRLSVPNVTALDDDVRVRLPLGNRHEGSLELLPDGAMGLLFRITAGSLMSPCARQGDLCAIGPRTRAAYKTGATPALALFMRLTPGTASSILGIPANELTNRIARLEELWGLEATHLLERLLAADCVDEMSTLVQATVRTRSARRSESAATHTSRHAVRLITQNPAPVRITELASSLGITPRHLRRIFATTVGMGPKQFARVVRFRRAVRLAASGENWATVALNAGYFDQAHMICDFRALTGRSPQKFARRVGRDSGGI